jgi:broad-specificity NMP kinase
MARQAIMENVKAEDFDQIDEEAVEVHEGHSVDVVVSVRLSPEESQLLSELAARDGSDPIETMRAALRHYAARRSQRTPG